MSKLKIERLGGFAGFGSKNLQSIGEIDFDKLSKEDKKTVEDLFKSHGKAETSRGADGFRYKISRTTSAGTETIEASEEKIPGAIKKCVKDEII